MPGTTNDLHGVLDDYRKFVREKNLSPPAHQPYLVRWVREFLLFAWADAGYSFEQTLDLFLAEGGGRVTVHPTPAPSRQGLDRCSHGGRLIHRPRLSVLAAYRQRFATTTRREPKGQRT